MNDWCAIEVRAVTDTGVHLHKDVVWIKLQRQSTGAKAAAAAAAAGSEGGGDGTGEARHGRRSMLGLSAVVQAARASKRGSLLMFRGAVLCCAALCYAVCICPALALLQQKESAGCVSYVAIKTVTSIEHGQVRPRGRSPCVIDTGAGTRRTQLCRRRRRRPVFPPPRS